MAAALMRARRADAYVARHRLAEQLSELLTELVKEGPEDPLAFLGHRLLERSSHQRTGPSEPTPQAETECVTGGVAAAVTKGQAQTWTAAGWLSSEAVDKTLASTLVAGCPENEFDELRALGASDNLEDELRKRLSAGIELLVTQLAPKLRGLATFAAVGKRLLRESPIPGAKTGAAKGRLSFRLSRQPALARRSTTTTCRPSSLRTSRACYRTALSAPFMAASRPSSARRSLGRGRRWPRSIASALTRSES